MTQAKLYALTLWRPWSTLIAKGVKKIENRPWAPLPTMLEPGEWFAIHAGKSYDDTVISFALQRGVPIEFFDRPGPVSAIECWRYIATAAGRTPTRRRAAASPAAGYPGRATSPPTSPSVMPPLRQCAAGSSESSGSRAPTDNEKPIAAAASTALSACSAHMVRVLPGQ